VTILKSDRSFAAMGIGVSSQEGGCDPFPIPLRPGETVKFVK